MHANHPPNKAAPILLTILISRLNRWMRNNTQYGEYSALEKDRLGGNQAG